MGLSLPQDLNFTHWQSPLESKLGSCSYQFSIPRLKFGKSLFKNLNSENSVNHLAQYITNDGGLNSYLLTRWWTIFLIVLGILLLIFLLFISTLTRLKMRERFSSWFCGICRYKDRPKLSELTSKVRIWLVLSNISLTLSLLGVGICLLIANVQTIQGTHSLSCNMWQQVYGHFFGASKLSNHESLPEPVALLWVGTTNLIRELQQLVPDVKPSDDNTILVELLQEKENLINETQILQDGFRDIANQTLDLMDYHVDLFSKAWLGAIGNKTDLPEMVLQDTIKYKNVVLTDTVNQTLEDGYSTIDSLLTKYAGPTSTLLQRAYAAVLDTHASVRDIDVALGNFAIKWESIDNKVRGLIYTLSAFSIITLAWLLPISLFGFYLNQGLLHHMYRGSSPKKCEKSSWGVVYISFIVCAGVLFLLSTLWLLAATVGKDVCGLVKDLVLEQGQWELLGDDVLYPVVNGTIAEVDMRTVLDTCMKNNGNGEVAVSLGLDGRIAELQTDIESATEDIMSQTESILKEKVHQAQINVLGMAYQEALKCHVQKPGANRITFKQFAGISFDHKDHQTEGYNNIFSPLALLGYDTSSFLGLTLYAMDLLGRGLWTHAASPNDAYDFLNELAQEIKNQGIESFPTSFCGLLLEDDVSSCPENATILNGETQWDTIADWVELIPTDFVWANYSTEVPKRVWQLISDLRSLEAVAQYSQNDNDSLTYNEERKNDLLTFASYRDSLKLHQKQIMNAVNDYVYNLVIPRINSVLARANKIPENANCQFEGTAISKAAIVASCDAQLPGAVTASLVSFILGIVSLIAAAYAWQWVAYLQDSSLVDSSAESLWVQQS